MKQKLYIFGDSFSAGFSFESNWTNNYVNWKGYTPKGFSEIISQKLNLELINLADNASDNYSILQKFCDNVKNIKKNDLVIIGWSSPLRFRLVSNDWITILPNNDKFSTKEIDKTKISESTLTEILLNRDDIRYCNEVNSWIKLLNNLDKKIIHWTPFDQRLDCMFLNKFETIFIETNGELNDWHFSENGHLQLSDLFINKFKKKNKMLL
jgi:hypothetical protein